VRLFVAVDPPAVALDHLAEAIGRLRLGMAAAAGTNVRLAARPLWHVTLAFLGELPDDRAPDVAAAVREGVARWQGGGAPAPTLRLTGGGQFGAARAPNRSRGGRRRSTAVWVGLAGDVDTLRSLGDALRKELRRARVPYDHKPLRPHLTFARPGERLPAADLAADLAALREYEGPGWTVEAVHLVRSQLGPKPVHDRIATVPLVDRP
jgi:2'-5' RNA ligase